jgi:hypothetical protein
VSGCVLVDDLVRVLGAALEFHEWKAKGVFVWWLYYLRFIYG